MYDIDQNIFILVAMVCIWTTLIVNRALDNLLVTIFSLPLFLHSALAAIVVLSDYRVLLAYDKTLNLVLFAGMG